jgi:DNA/RNA endonuclease YhcR with UshA esterase domain
MTRFTYRALYIFFLGLLIAGPACAQKKLAAAEAKDHFGETAIVCGEVVSTSYADSSNGQPTFINLDRPYPNTIFTVVIWGENRSKFGKPEDDYKGKRICVSGKITAYAGKPEIIAADPKQIRIE